MSAGQSAGGSRIAQWSVLVALVALVALIGGILLLAFVVGGVLSLGTTSGKPALNTAEVPAQYVRWVEAAGQACATVSPPQIAAQIDQESGFNDGPGEISPAGAEGIAQFLPGTWRTWGRAVAPGPVTPFNAPDAIIAMGRYDCWIASQVASVPGDALANMLAGYNAGPGAVRMCGGVPPFPETQQYVASIEALIPKYEFTTAGRPRSAAAFANAEIDAAEQYLGFPYVWGGGNTSGPTGGPPPGFDCSGLVLYAVYVASGHTITLVHYANTQAQEGTAVPPSQLVRGDVIAIQDDPSQPGVYTHIVIYLGGGQVIEAPHTGADVRIIPLADFNGDVETIRWYGP